MQEALATQEHLIRLYANGGVILTRGGSQHAHVAPAKIFPCRDGYVYLYISRRHWKKFLEVWADHPEELDAPALIADPVRRGKAAFVNGLGERGKSILWAPPFLITGPRPSGRRSPELGEHQDELERRAYRPVLKEPPA